MIIYLVPLLPAESNGSPGGYYSEADHFIPPYLAFLPVGFAMPPMSPLKRWALTLSRYVSLPKTGKRPRHFTLILQKAGRYIFCCTFLPVTGTPRYGALRPVELGLSSHSNHERVGTGDHLACLTSFFIMIL